MRKQRTPTTAKTVTNYEEFVAYIRAWVAGKLNLLIVVGDAGLAKGKTIREELIGQGVEACDIEGKITPFRLHCRVYWNKEQCELSGSQELHTRGGQWAHPPGGYF